VIPRPAIALALALLTLAVYAPARGHGFVDYDDDEYVFANPHVRGGLDAESIAWAFTSTELSNWHPLTWLSHMLDCQLFGLDPAGHHMVSVALHAANVALLFLLLAWLTGQTWPSAFAAALFAVHPLNVESVAWIAERKNVLCTLFWLLTLGAYGLWTRSPGPARYAAMLAGAALALMSKPMAVSLPFPLLLLDYWPLGRMSRAAALRRVAEKAPLFVLSAASSAMTFHAQLTSGTLVAVEAIPLRPRLFNAVISYVSYVGKLLWPATLGVFYPHRESAIPAWQVAVGAAALLAVTALVLRSASRAPYLAVGWLWYAVTLIPVIGIVQVGTQAMADRYLYVPAIGLFIALAFAAAPLAARAPRPEAWAAAAAVLLCALTLRMERQLSAWRDSYSLFSATVAAVPDSWVAHYNLGNALAAAGRAAEAEAEFRETVRLKPRFGRAHNNLGDALDAQGRHPEALQAYEEAIRVSPQLVEAQNNRAVVLSALGRREEAVQSLRKTVALQPGFAEAWLNLGIVLRQMGRLPESAQALDEAVTLRPEMDMARYQRAVTLLQAGDEQAARRDLAVLEGRNARLAGMLGSALQGQARK